MMDRFQEIDGGIKKKERIKEALRDLEPLKWGLELMPDDNNLIIDGVLDKLNKIEKKVCEISVEALLGSAVVEDRKEVDILILGGMSREEAERRIGVKREFVNKDMEKRNQGGRGRTNYNSSNNFRQQNYQPRQQQQQQYYHRWQQPAPGPVGQPQVFMLPFPQQPAPSQFSGFTQQSGGHGQQPPVGY
jgi:hypothetical protein